MFSLFFTTPAKNPRGRKSRQRGRDQQPAKDRQRGGMHEHDPAPPPQLTVTLKQALVTYGLLLIWVGLMAFGIVAMVNPKWLQELSRPGAAVEARTHKHRGDAALHQGEYRLAMGQYERTLEIRPDDMGALANLAIAYDRTGQSDRAVVLLEQALERSDEHARKGIIHYNLGEVIERQGDSRAALAHYQQAIGFDVEQDLVYRKLGQLYLAAQNLVNAREAFEKTLECQLDLTLPYKYMLQRTLEACWDDSYVYGDTQAERAELAEVIQKQLTGEITPEGLERYDLTIVKDLQAHDQEIAKTHNHLGVIYAHLGDLDTAIAHFEQSLKYWPGNTDGTRNLEALRQMRAQKVSG